MKALPDINPKRKILLDEYRVALQLWSETRALYPADADEVLQATSHLEDLEWELIHWENEALKTQKSPRN